MILMFLGLSLASLGAAGCAVGAGAEDEEATVQQGEPSVDSSSQEIGRRRCHSVCTWSHGRRVCRQVCH